MNDKFKKENQISLNIFKNIDKLNTIFQKKFDQINLINVFGLELQRYMSSSIKSKMFQTNKNSNIRFPFVHLDYLNNNKKFNFYEKKEYKFLDESPNNKYGNTLKHTFVKSVNFFSRSKFSYYAINFNDYKKKYKNYLKNLNPQKIFFSKIYFENFSEQCSLLKSFLKKYRIKNKFNNKYYEENFINFITIFITKKNYKDKKLKDNLLIGSNMNIYNRLMSAQYLQNKKNVISFNHANYSSSIYEAPENDIGEYAMCSKYLDLGKFKFKKKFIKSNFFAPKIILVKNEIENLSILNMREPEIKKILYIPNSYNSFRRYGFHRDVDDFDYIKFQKKLFNNDNSIYFKIHPKQLFHYKFLNKEKYINGKLENIINKYNLFIIDMISQPFFSLAKTNLKILYLNFNHRKVRKNVLNQLKKRAYVLNTNLKKINQQEINTALKKAYNFKILSKDIIKLCS